ncbi:MAG: MerR family transcriptional regulator [Megasphaera sp.]|jgi:DNA-binding transcriptional MerR regulator|uniref:MerR family transcriptional regulator n=1 Tax=Megasphaera sueciensis TaxID=349094 RepID=UPI003CFEE906|nr:MerR family transcriptional regulator [Megasphaera sp.]MCI1823781.1 MerR family transcriptional regulator [Megasphaera sp.]
MHIKKMVEETGLAASTLRYYEKKELLRVARDGNGYRDYDAKDIAWVQFLERLKDTGMPLKDIQRYAMLRYEGDATMSERLVMLETHREYVVEQQNKWHDCREHLEKKIKYYQSGIEKNGNQQVEE